MVNIVNQDAEYRFEQDLGPGPEWGTPKYIWNPLSDSIDGFDLDPASGAETEPIADVKFTVEDDGLSKPWFGDVWINPPYSREHNPVWSKKILKESNRESVSTITALIVASTSSDWFQENITQCDYLTLIDHRIKFESEDSYVAASFGNVIVSFGDFNSSYIETLHDLGMVYEPIRFQGRVGEYEG